MTPTEQAGCFMTFEGGEGTGKSTQIRLLADALRERGHDVEQTREPGGSAGAEAVRHVLLSGAAEEFGVRMEAILFAAARSDHIEQRIRPAIDRGAIVLCDRFLDSTRVYQGVTGNLEPAFLNRLERVCLNGLIPDRTILLDMPAEAGLVRAKNRAAGNGGDAAPDRFEKEALAVHESRRQAFLELAAREPERFVVIDAARPIEAVSTDVLAAATDSIRRRGLLPAGTGSGR